MPKSYNYPVHRIEQRSLELVECNPKVDYYKFKYHVREGIDIAIDITGTEIEMLNKFLKKFRKEPNHQP